MLRKKVTMVRRGAETAVILANPLLFVPKESLRERMRLPIGMPSAEG
ncbi:MAG: hypothetical protein WCX28_11940 [Bacteriovoracaceae bacterium]|nr:hypothetical protein [Bacteroidota bacterium]